MPGKGFSGERFSLVSRREGKIQVELLGDKQEIEYQSANYMNADATIGYAVVKSVNPAKPDEKDEDKILFVSKMPSCTVYTMLADRNDELPFGVEGVRVWGVLEGPLENYYDQHLRAMKDEQPLKDAEWLKDALENAPQTIVDIAMKMLGQLLDAIGGPDGIMKAMGDALAGPDSPLNQMVQGIGNAMKEGLGGGDKGCECGQDGEGSHTCETNVEDSGTDSDVDTLTEEEGCGCNCMDEECKGASEPKRKPRKAAAVRKPEPKKTVPAKKPVKKAVSRTVSKGKAAAARKISSKPKTPKKGGKKVAAKKGGAGKKKRR